MDSNGRSVLKEKLKEIFIYISVITEDIFPLTINTTQKMKHLDANYQTLDSVLTINYQDINIE